MLNPGQSVFAVLHGHPPPDVLVICGALEPGLEQVPEPLGEGLCVAVFAAGADFDAAPDRVPGGIRPLDAAGVAHVVSFCVSLNPCSSEFLNQRLLSY